MVGPPAWSRPEAGGSAALRPAVVGAAGWGLARCPPPGVALARATAAQGAPGAGSAALRHAGSAAVAWRPSARPKAAATARLRRRAPPLREQTLLVAPTPPASTPQRAAPQPPWLPPAAWSASGRSDS